MSEERTQAPSKRRRLLARERGMVARSPELTAACGFLAAVLLLGAWGDDLIAALIAAARAPWMGDGQVAINPDGVAALMRSVAFGVLTPLGAILGGIALAAVTAHQAQVGGLWIPGLLAPDPTRLWATGSDGEVAARSLRGAWSLAKALIVLAIAAWSLRTHLADFQQLGKLDAHALVLAVAGLLNSLLRTLAVALLILGGLDFLLQYRRIEALLHATPEEHLEDQKAVEGDPVFRARRRRAAESRRFDPAEAVTGAALLLIGTGGLTLALGGGPPARRPVLVRAVARGMNGVRLRRAADHVGLPRLESAALARHLSRAGSGPIPAPLAEELAAAWPRWSPGPNEGPIPGA